MFTHPLCPLLARPVPHDCLLTKNESRRLPLSVQRQRMCRAVLSGDGDALGACDSYWQELCVVADQEACAGVVWTLPGAIWRQSRK